MLREEKEIRRLRDLYLNDILDQIHRGGRPRRSHATEKLRVLQWVLGEIQEAP